ncbi:killer cell immunoglobulin-like receptor 3DL1 [Mesocricetus auratus]|uniref:Killer cell immunoglobulin-like receptor 3DL1 n=1 Tax=Mesocricetus auratus TaxID=10036 RepID=A0ABM2WN53_MESAU|nr:killer cell immunoglobulin-like receptor 3DL1 [Mesocricetus auratus]
MWRERMCSDAQLSVLWSSRRFSLSGHPVSFYSDSASCQLKQHDAVCAPKHFVHCYHKYLLTAWPSPVVALGQHVELRCDSHRESDLFQLYKELGDFIPQVHERIFQKSMLLGPVTPAHGGTYRCYNHYHQNPNDLSLHSNPLKIIISGIYRKPFLFVPHTYLVNSGEKMTLKCHSQIVFDIFILTLQSNKIINESFQHSAESHRGGSHASFSIGPTTPAHAGTYTCYGSYNHTPYEWSESSDPVDIVITGLHRKPSLAVLMGPVVMSGENMTLACISDHQFDMFHLSREQVPQGHGLPAMQSHNGTFQANFILGPVIQKGNYRCYGSFRNSSFVWSSPSDPLYLPVSVNSSGNCTLCTESESKTYNHRNLRVVIGLSITMVLVLLLIILLYSCCYAKKSKSQEQASECHLCSVRIQDWRNTANRDQESKTRTTLNRQDPEREEGQEVTYLEFDQRTFKQKLTTPISQIPKEFSTDPSVYMEIRK